MIVERDAPQLRTRRITLPSTTLNVGEAGEGEPVIIVPATISLVEDWAPLVRFVGLRYRALIFELPGHGRSEPYPDGYTSGKVAGTVGELADTLGADRFTLMGFSFGGLLALTTLRHLEGRVSRIVLLSPFVMTSALKHDRVKLATLRMTIGALRSKLARRGVLAVLHDERTVALIDWYMRQVGMFETAADLRARLTGFTASTLDVFLAQVEEVLSTGPGVLAGPYDVPCLFGMSRLDTMLDFASTRTWVHENFADLTELVWEWPYHAPPVPLALEDYMRDHAAVLTW